MADEAFGTTGEHLAGDGVGGGSIGRRRFLTVLMAAPALTIAARLADDAFGAQAAGAGEVPSFEHADYYDAGDFLISAGAPTSMLLVLEVSPDNRVKFELPRIDFGQGIATAVAMVIADELDAPLDHVEVRFADARVELLFNQLTGASNSMRALWDPVRQTAAAARARLLAAAAARWGVPAGTLRTENARVFGPGGRVATFGELSEAAADPGLGPVTATPKALSEHKVIGRPTTRIDARDVATGRAQWSLDLPVEGALPCVVARPPTIHGTVRSFDDRAAKAIPGVVATAVIPTGVAVVAETFSQALRARKALEITWGSGTVDGFSDEGIRERLRALAPPFGPPAPGVDVLEAEFEFASLVHAPMEVHCAVADVRPDRAEVWSGLQAPIITKQTIAETLGLPLDKVTVHVVRAGGAYGKRAYFEAALEAAQISQAVGRPVKLQWTRDDDVRHGRQGVPSQHRIRVSLAQGSVVGHEHRIAAVEMKWGFGFGEALTAAGAEMGGNGMYSQGIIHLQVRTPYNFGATDLVLQELQIGIDTVAWRSVWSAMARCAEEVMVDEVAAKLDEDPLAFRLRSVKNDRARAVLHKVADAGQWDRPMAPGTAQGLGFHEEYRSCVAYLVELDARDRRNPRVTKAVVAVDVGHPINPRGLAAQMEGGLSDAIARTLLAGLHIDNGAVRESGLHDYKLTRQFHYPNDVQVFVMPSTTGRPGGAGELGVTAAGGAVANAWARATGTKARRFPLLSPE